MRFHDGFVGLFFMVLGGLVLWQVSSFPTMPGQLIGPATFPSVFGYAFLVGGGLIVFQCRRAGVARLLALEDGWRMPDRVVAAVLAIVGTLLLAAYFEDIGYPIGLAALMIALFIVLGYRSLFWVALSILFTVATYYGIAKGLVVPLPLGPLS